MVGLKFFKPEELERYYNKDFKNISPTDAPLNRFKSGCEEIQCHECNDYIEVNCGHPSMGLMDVAYCEKCDLKYRRKRELVNSIDNELDYQYNTYRTDEREEYVCKDCKQRHPLTIPIGKLKPITPTITSHESIQFKCKCGNIINMNNLTFPDVKKCSNCDRKYDFNIL